MTVFSRPLQLTIAGSVTCALAWAVWYDSYRRSKPDYKKNLVEKRKQQLIEKRKLNDPDYYINNCIPLCDNPLDPQSQQVYMMKELQKGEQMLESGEIKKGSAHIAMGLAYLSQQQIQMTLANLRQALPQQMLSAVVAQLTPARKRCQTHMMTVQMSSQEKLRAQQTPIIEEKAEITEIPDGTDSLDGDSIDGDTEVEKSTADDMPGRAASPGDDASPTRTSLQNATSEGPPAALESRKPDSQVKLHELAADTGDELNSDDDDLSSDSLSEDDGDVVEILEQETEIPEQIEEVLEEILAEPEPVEEPANVVKIQEESVPADVVKTQEESVPAAVTASGDDFLNDPQEVPQPQTIESEETIIPDSEPSDSGDVVVEAGDNVVEAGENVVEVESVVPVDVVVETKKTTKSNDDSVEEDLELD